VNMNLYSGDRKVYRERDPVYERIANRLKRDPCHPRASLFVWGYAPAFYYYAGMRPASRFVVMGQARLTGYVSGNLGSLNKRSEGVQQHWDWLMADLEKNHTTYVLDTAPAAIYRWNHFPLNRFPRLADYVAKNFERIDEIDEVVIYRRRHCSSDNETVSGSSLISPGLHGKHSVSESASLSIAPHKASQGRSSLNPRTRS